MQKKERRNLFIKEFFQSPADGGQGKVVRRKMVDKGQVTDDIEAAIVDRNDESHSKDSAQLGTSINAHMVTSVHVFSFSHFEFVFQTFKVQPELLKVLLSSDFL